MKNKKISGTDRSHGRHQMGWDAEGRFGGWPVCGLYTESQQYQLHDRAGVTEIWSWRKALLRAVISWDLQSC